MFVRATDLASPESASAARHAHSDCIPVGLLRGWGSLVTSLGPEIENTPHFDGQPSSRGSPQNASKPPISPPMLKSRGFLRFLLVQ
jgi:hypothetical protein